MNGKIIDYQKARDLIKNGVHEKLNRRQAEMLFVENAVLIGQKDGVTEETVKSLFGVSATGTGSAIIRNNTSLMTGSSWPAPSTMC